MLAGNAASIGARGINARVGKYSFPSCAVLHSSTFVHHQSARCSLISVAAPSIRAASFMARANAISYEDVTYNSMEISRARSTTSYTDIN
jgi:hypothetical protein